MLKITFTETSTEERWIVHGGAGLPGLPVSNATRGNVEVILAMDGVPIQSPMST